MMPMKLVTMIATSTTQHLEPVGPEERRDPAGPCVPRRSGGTGSKSPFGARQPAAVATTGATGPGHGAHATTTDAHRAEPSTGTFRTLAGLSPSIATRSRAPGTITAMATDGTARRTRRRDRRLAARPREPDGPPAGDRATRAPSDPSASRRPAPDHRRAVGPRRSSASPTARTGRRTPLHPYQKWARRALAPRRARGARRPCRRAGGRARSSPTGSSGSSPGSRRRAASTAPEPRRRPAPDARVAGGSRRAGRRSATGWPASRGWRAIIERLVAWQWPDGGWNCDRHRDGRHASFNESWRPLRALAAYAAAAPRRRCAGRATPRAAADRAAEFLLVHEVVNSHRTGELAHPTLDGQRWPPYWHYDRLIGLRVLREAGALGDRRTPDAVADLRARASRDGRWRADAQVLARTGPGRLGRRAGRLDRRGLDQGAHDPGARGAPRGRGQHRLIPGPGPARLPGGRRRRPRRCPRSRASARRRSRPCAVAGRGHGLPVAVVLHVARDEHARDPARAVLVGETR